MAQLVVRGIAAIFKTADKGASKVLSYKRYGLMATAGVASMLLFKSYVYELDPSEGPSMYPTISDGGNTSGINKLYKHGHGLKIGDVVLVKSPRVPNQQLGKRVIGLPGDYILRSPRYSATPGNTPLPGITDWKKRVENDATEEEWEEPVMIQVPAGHVWIEGDNLAWSRDSREFGPVPLALIVGRQGWVSEGLLSTKSLKPGKNLRKIEDDEMRDILGPD